MTFSDSSEVIKLFLIIFNAFHFKFSIMTNRLLPALALLFLAFSSFSQTNPIITSWLRNTTGITGRHYVGGNSTPINDNTLANVQKVEYSANSVYVRCTGIPAYIIGPFLDGNPSQGTNQNNFYKMPLNPVKNNGTPTNTTLGNIGVFINGVALFDYRDGVSYNLSAGSDKGGPLGGMGNGVWNRDAVVAERQGFDCAKGHPAMGNYHHHQNPSAFNLDLNTVSNVCDLYLADGLYAIDSTTHSPLLGFAYDGFPIYGAYAYKNVDGTGGIVRMKSSYSLRDITVRTHYYDGTDVTDGPPVNSNYPLGRYREDYQYTPTTTATPDYLDEHNGRFCVTPEYPNGIYCYFATVNEQWNSVFPYVVGPTFYGVKSVTKVQAINEPTTVFNGVSATEDVNLVEQANLNVYPNPTSDLIIIQAKSLLEQSLKVELLDMAGKVVLSKDFPQGSTICHLETETLYNGVYFLAVKDSHSVKTFKVVLER